MGGGPDYSRSITPGPQSYLAEKLKIKNREPAYSIGGSRRMKELEESPGPGAYENNLIKIRTRAPGYSIGNYKQKEKEVTPGPGQYWSEKKTYKGHFIGTSKRMPNQHPENNPGPGQYRVAALVGDVPHYSYSRDETLKYR